MEEVCNAVRGGHLEDVRIYLEKPTSVLFRICFLLKARYCIYIKPVVRLSMRAAHIYIIRFVSNILRSLRALL